MCVNFNDIAREWFEEWKMPFINYIRANFRVSYDDARDLYTETWIELRNVIVEKRATDNRWRSLIFVIGWRMALKTAERRPQVLSVDQNWDGADEKFNIVEFEMEKKLQMKNQKAYYEDPELKLVLAAELSCIPEPCNKILKLYYEGEMNMTEIAQTMNYSGPRSAIVTKKRCFEKLKARVKNTARMIGLID